LLLVASPVAAIAQEEGPSASEEALPDLQAPAPAVAAPPQGIESIEITGEREITNVQDEAQAITAFDMGDLDKLNISNVDGLASNVPGLHVGQQGQAAIITLRGVGTENASLTGESGVAFHVDGIYYGRPAAARVAFYDIEMIDVKRGPQGLRGGKNSTSGTINVNTRNPEMGEFQTEADFLMGNYDRRRARGVVNIPMGEFVAARMAMFWEERDGYLDLVHAPHNPNPIDNKQTQVDASDSHDPFDADNFGLRGKLRIQPTDSLDMVLGYHWFKETGNGPQADLVPITSQLARNPCFDPGSDFLAAYYDPDFRSTMPRAAACNTFTRKAVPPRPGRPGIPGKTVHNPAIEDRDPRKIYSENLEFPAQDDRYWGTTARIDLDAPQLPLLGDTHLKAIAGYNRTENQFNWDYDASSLDQFRLLTSSNVHEYTAQLEWSGEIAERLEWQSSLYYGHETGDALTITPGFGGSSGDPTNPGGPNPGSSTLYTFQDVENKSYGAALYGAYHLTDMVTLSLGNRWIKDRKRSYLFRLAESRNVEACQPPGTGELWSITEQIPGCEITYRGRMWGSRLEFRPVDDHTFYAGIDRGYKSGGFALGGVGGYVPERIWAYSLGMKSEFFDQRLQVNLEGFLYNYEDMQIALIDGTEIRTENTDARMYGWELETRASPVDGLNLRGVVSFIKTETIDYYTLDPASVGMTPDEFPHIPFPQFQEVRLNERDRAEAEGEKFADRTGCHGQRCGNIGTSGRLDGLDNYSGKQLSRTPKWKFTFSGEYQIPLGALGSLTPHVQYTWQDDTYFRVFNRDFDLQEAFHKTDVKLIWDSPEQKWSAEVFVENIEDAAVKDFILIGSRLFGGPPLAWYSAPRFYGFRIGFKY
jgi:iron complex outermembrane receptor protein